MSPFVIFKQEDEKVPVAGLDTFKAGVTPVLPNLHIVHLSICVC